MAWGNVLLELDVDPDSCEWESDTGVLPPPAVAALEADVAIEEISKLLREIPFDTATAFGDTGVGASPEPQVLTDAATST